MADVFEHKFDTPLFKGTTKVHTGLFIDGKWVEPVEKAKIE
jgi:aldehyde dehydrogenase (NAD+)